STSSSICRNICEVGRALSDSLFTTTRSRITRTFLPSGDRSQRADVEQCIISTGKWHSPIQFSLRYYARISIKQPIRPERSVGYSRRQEIRHAPLAIFSPSTESHRKTARKTLHNAS
ncbi:hypothetical protein CH063_05302, partial [Colletotrichum higginsianum]